MTCALVRRCLSLRLSLWLSSIHAFKFLSLVLSHPSFLIFLGFGPLELSFSVAPLSLSSGDVLNCIWCKEDFLSPLLAFFGQWRLLEAWEASGKFLKRTTYTRIKREFYLSRECSFSNSWTGGEININSNWRIVCWRKRGMPEQGTIYYKTM